MKIYQEVQLLRRIPESLLDYGKSLLNLGDVNFCQINFVGAEICYIECMKSLTDWLFCRSAFDLIFKAQKSLFSTYRFQGDIDKMRISAIQMYRFRRIKDRLWEGKS